jgi:hypothetical protein
MQEHGKSDAANDEELQISANFKWTRAKANRTMFMFNNYLKTNQEEAS